MTQTIVQRPNEWARSRRRRGGAGADAGTGAQRQPGRRPRPPAGRRPAQPRPAGRRHRADQGDGVQPGRRAGRPRAGRPRASCTAPGPSAGPARWSSWTAGTSAGSASRSTWTTWPCSCSTCPAPSAGRTGSPWTPPRWPPPRCSPGPRRWSGRPAPTTRAVGVTVAVPRRGAGQRRPDRAQPARAGSGWTSRPGSPTSGCPSPWPTTPTCPRWPSGRPGRRRRSPDLVYLTGAVGVGGGVLTGGRLLRGSTGLGGEVGHLALDPGRRAVRLRAPGLLGDRRRPGRAAARGRRPR